MSMHTVALFWYGTQPPKELGRVVLLPSGRCELRGDFPRELREQLEHGVLVWPPSQPRLTLADGEAFLRGLLREFSGSYLRAQEIP